MYHAVYRVVDGALVSVGRGEPPATLPGGLAAKTFAGDFDLSRFVWDTGTLAFVPRPPVERTVLTSDEFWDRLTAAELLAIEQQGWASTQAAARIRLATKIIERADALDVSLPRIRGAVQQYVDAGILTTQRANQIFAPVVQP